MKLLKTTFYYILFSSPFLLLFWYFSNYLEYYYSCIIILLITYLIYIGKVILEYIFIRILLKIKINYLVLYPFSFDPKPSFFPLDLLCNIENFQDSQYLNIPFNESDNIKKNLYFSILLCSKISLICSTLIMSLIIYGIYLNYYIFIIMTIFAIIISISTFIKVDDYIGIDYFVKKYGIDIFLLQSYGYKYLKKQYFDDYFRNKSIEIDPIREIKIIANYISLLVQNDYNPTKDDLNIIIESLLNMEDYFYSKDCKMKFQMDFLLLIRLILVLYHHIDENLLIQLEIFLKDYLDCLNPTGLKILDKKTDEFRSFLMNYKNKDALSCLEKKRMRLPEIVFRFQKEIENKIKKII